MEKMVKDLRKDLGVQIRNLRKAKELTQEELGEMAALSYKYVGELERGQVNVSLDSLVRIAESLGVKIGDLFSKEKVTVQKVILKEESPLSKLSPQDLLQIKDTLKLLNKVFAKG